MIQCNSPPTLYTILYKSSYSTANNGLNKIILNYQKSQTIVGSYNLIQLLMMKPPDSLARMFIEPFSQKFLLSQDYKKSK